MKQINDQFATIYIDVDRTLTNDCGNTFNQQALYLIKKLSKKVNIIIWSSGGFNYAKEIIEKAKLEEYVCLALPKPAMMIDDLAPFVWSSWLDIINEGWNEIDIIEENLTGFYTNDNAILRNKETKKESN